MRRSIAPWLALGSAVLLTFAAAALIDATARGRDRMRFSRAAHSARDRITSSFEKHADLLRGVAAVLASNPTLDAEGFPKHVTIKHDNNKER